MGDETVENAVAWAEMHGKFDILIQKQEEIGEDVAKIKQAVYHPDSGLYARLRELESWKETSSRLLWMIITSVITLTIATVYKSL
ncbi:MAG: hypothetical protein GOVbin630_195 [Prokaryotic dsDNA virus sp.]|nr:MAG: hypothetical protein GOVbin630_195 [Prokaryotic dsDNA virus sp.]|tara:strand:+ start:5093 stop:5347 length:255 start_codon:yes stop_codon:yes gene_type:complete